MVCELPMLMEMDINPLILDEHGAVAVDARMVIAQQPVTNARYGHMAIYPYPTHLISHYQLLDGTNIVIRPTRPEDAELVQKFVHNLSEESRYFRFMTTINELSTRMLVQFTQIDYSREMALIAIKQEDEQEVEIGVSRYIINPDAESCEFALVVADAMQGKGLGRQLMLTLMDAAREHGLKRMEGVVLKNNTNMLRLMADLGFKSRTSDDDDSLKVVSRIL
jgi:acetyltransferase